MPDRNRVLSAVASRRWLLEPALALALFAAWAIAGLPFDAAAALALVFYCGAVALSRVLPALALGLTWVAVAVELAESSSMHDPFRILATVATAVSVTGIAAHGDRLVRWLDFASAILLAPLSAYLYTVRGDLRFPRFGPLIAGYDSSQGFGLALMSLLLAVVLVAAWLLGFLISRQRAAQASGANSVLLWLASGGDAREAEADPDRFVLVRPLRRPQLAADIAGAVVFAVFALLLEAGDRSSYVVMIVFAVAVALRRLSPGVSLSVAWLAAVLQMTTGHSILASDVAVLGVLYATAAYGDRVVRAAGLISAGVGALVAALYLALTSALAQGYYDLLSGQFTSIALQFAFLFVVSATVLGLSWVLGLLVRTWRTAREARRARAVAELDRNRAVEDVVVEQERTRIARDMHDVVAHSLAVVIAQADGARYARSRDPEAVDEALRTIASTARSALADVRVLLAELRQAQPEGPQPSLADLDQTVDQVRAAGLPVTLERTGRIDDLGSAQQLAAYRIVQEALTNALRHGDTAHPASVVLAGASRPDGSHGLSITVRNRMRTTPPELPSTAAVPRIGHGLPGMRERASLAGGTLIAEPQDDSFVVSAFIPATPVASGAVA